MVLSQVLFDNLSSIELAVLLVLVLIVVRLLLFAVGPTVGKEQDASRQEVTKRLLAMLAVIGAILVFLFLLMVVAVYLRDAGVP